MEKWIAHFVRNSGELAVVYNLLIESEYKKSFNTQNYGHFAN
jgi:hypothetical protein